MSGLFYVAMCTGFLVIETRRTPTGERTRAFTVPNPRVATPFDSFHQADAAGKWAGGYLYPPSVRYYAVLQPST